MYSTELIAEIKAVYPDSPDLHEMAEAGNVMVGRILDDSSYGSVSVDDILTALSLEEIQAKARIIKRKSRVYGMWCKEDPRRK